MRNHPIRHCAEKAAGAAMATGARRRGRAGAAGCGSWRRLVAWLVLTAFHLTPPGVPVARAAPEGVEFVHGEGAVEQIGSHTEITTFTDQTKAHANSFDIAPEESVHAQQPSSTSMLLIQVDPGAPTDISGMLSSNAIVYLLNTAGVYFGNEAVVDVGRLVAGAGEISDEDFLAGVDHFANVSGPVEVAAGARLQAGSVALVGRTVANHGTIVAPDGMIALVAGGDVLLSKLDGRVLVRVEAPPEDPGAWGIQQTGTLDAGAGSVTLAAGDTYSLAMNHSGITRGLDVQLEGGDGGLVAVSGEIDASNRQPGGRGGSIRVLGELVAVLDAALDASGDAGGGEILVGGDLRGQGDLRTARRTYVSDEAALRADAVDAGDGGRIIVWAGEKTGFYGTLSARGGAAGGDGGFAEISGRASLESRGDIDLSAPAGRSGTLLYDPEDIEIVGGAPSVSDPPDGDDVGLDADLLVGDTGTAGDILFTDLGDPSGVAPFTIYESELEGTDADIILRANRSVIARGTFDHQTEEYQEGDNVVRLMNDNNFFIFTATPTDLESTEFAGIDLVSNVVNGDALTWQVSGEGAIFLDTTQFNPSAVGEDATQSAPILVGGLVAEQTLDTLTNQGSANTVSIFTGARGATATGPAIAVGEIRANGLDAEQNPEEGAPTLAATAGGRVFVQAEQGDVVVGRVIARGGSALDLAPLDLAEDGAGGGLVELRAPDGDLTLETEIDVSGGDGLAGTLFLGEIAGLPVERKVGDAGSGGTIDLCAGNGCDPTLQGGTEARHVFVQGDLTARGGEAVENAVTGETANGGAPGVVKLTSTTGDVYAGGSRQVTFDASGGDGSGSGGGALEDIFSVLISAPGDLELDAHIIADGGTGFDGSGGARGLVKLSSESGSILAGTSSIRAEDGGGTETLEPRSDANADVQLLVDPLEGGVVEIGGVAVRGGAGNGDADGSDGGRIEIRAASILAGFSGGAAESGLDVRGGAAAGAGSDGAGGRIDLEATGDVVAQLSDDGGATLAITQHAADASTLVGFGDLASWTQIARIDAAAGVDPQTVRTLDTTQVDLAVDYRLDDDAAPSLAIGVEDAGIGAGGVKIGSSGARIANGGAIEADGVGVHVASRGTVIVEGTSIGSESNPLRAEALRDVPDVEPKLGLAASGDVRVDLSAETSEVYDVVDLMQADPDAATRIQSFADADPGTALDDIDIRSPEGEAIPSSHLVQVDTSTSDFTFAYRLLPTAADTDSSAARVVIESMNLGGDTLVEAVGDVQIGTDTPLDGGQPASLAIAANGNALSLVADAPAQSASASDGVGAIVDAGAGDAAIDMGDPGDGSSQLALLAGSGVGSSAEPLRVQRIGRVAGVTSDGGFYLGNDVGGDVRIAQFADVDGVERTGISATTGDVEVSNDAAGGRIVLEALAAEGAHVTSGGDQTYGAPVEIENARFDVLTQYFRKKPRGKHIAISNLTASNEARLVAGGDVTFEQRVDTSDDAIATFTPPGETGEPDVVQFVPGALIVDAQGVTSFGADVGTESPLVSLDVTDVYLAAGSTTFELSSAPIVDTDPNVVIDPAAFQVSGAFGRIDGASQLQVTAVDPGASLSQVTFRGDIGTSERLTGLEVQADRIEFTSAERVVTDSGGIALNVPPDDSATDGAPDAATIYDTQGSIAFETTGDFEIGRLQKFTGLGGLSIRAGGTASFGDLTALGIAVDAPIILWKWRKPGEVLLADGITTTTDAGSDLVANDIAFSSVPLWDGENVDPALLEGAMPVLVLGSGGVSAPGSLADFDVIHLNEAIDAVTPAILTGPDGSILDLTGKGPPLVGDPTSEVPRAAPRVAPELRPRTDATPPAARPQVDAEQVLAFVRCVAGSAAGACDPERAGVAPPPDSALGTPRAMDIAMRYRSLVVSPDARARLRAAFTLAVRAYRERTGDAEVNGARFYGFLRQSPGHGEALEQLNELARLFVEIEMLGMSEADTRSVQRALAEAFAELAGGVDANAVIDAVRASAIGLPV